MLCAKIQEGKLILYIPSVKLQEAFLEHIEVSEELSQIFELTAYFPEEGLLFCDLKGSPGRKKLQPILGFEKSETIQNALR